MNSKNLELHNYASISATAEANMDVRDFTLSPLPDTPVNSPLLKKGKPSVDEDNPHAIVARLSAIINARADSLENMVWLKVEGPKKTIDFVSEELMDIKKKVIGVDAKAKKEEERLRTVENRMFELECYTQR